MKILKLVVTMIIGLIAAMFIILAAYVVVEYWQVTIGIILAAILLTCCYGMGSDIVDKCKTWRIFK